ncbi:hypothetical protein HanRHA438_Chr16g0762211 [Helianthus annuus]|nr:hypothetical protein HanRHA438_Chr16g0762211 [Helianthus annuus]
MRTLLCQENQANIEQVIILHLDRYPMEIHHFPSFPYIYAQLHTHLMSKLPIVSM